LSDHSRLTRRLRKSSTDAESLAWTLLRDRRFLGLKFRRQYRIGKWVVDFYCFQHRLAVELDGSVHAQPTQELKDREKDKYLKRMGIRVLRLPNGIVLRDGNAFLKKIVESLQRPETKQKDPSPGH